MNVLMIKGNNNAVGVRCKNGYGCDRVVSAGEEAGVGVGEL